MKPFFMDFLRRISPGRAAEMDAVEDAGDTAGKDQYMSLAEEVVPHGEAGARWCSRKHILFKEQTDKDCFSCYLLDLSARERSAHPEAPVRRSLVGALFCLKGFHDGAVFPVNLGEDNSLIIGAEPDCDIVLSDDRISRRHLAISRRQGRAIVRDMNSLFHSAIRGEDELQWQVLDPEREYWFRDGSRLMVGDVEFLFRAASEQPESWDEPVAG